ncbi:MAG: (d)CMP kinase, partial [Bdellovibrionales bacterium]|nr:(d)CMP kinase [Bdellovibrionales bacterium]
MTVITIDGPAASGKSSVSRELARKLGWAWVSTGSFYRGLAYVANELKYDFNDEEALANLAVSDVWQVRLDPERTLVYFKNKDVTLEAHSESVGTLASKVSQYPKVRESLLQAQRNCASNVPGLIAEGRDCGSVVFPTAMVKVYLTADQENRAQRRAIEKGEDAKHIAYAQKERDQRDSERKVAPLQVPENA